MTCTVEVYGEVSGSGDNVEMRDTVSQSVQT